MRQTDRQTGTEKKIILLLHKVKDLSTNLFSFFLQISLPDDKHSNTQYVKQEFK